MPVIALPKRYLLSGMIFVGFFVMSGLRVNLNVAIGAMVKNHTAVVDGQTICRVSLYKRIFLYLCPSYDNRIALTFIFALPLYIHSPAKSDKNYSRHLQFLK